MTKFSEGQHLYYIHLSESGAVYGAVGAGDDRRNLTGERSTDQEADPTGEADGAV